MAESRFDGKGVYIPLGFLCAFLQLKPDNICNVLGSCMECLSGNKDVMDIGPELSPAERFAFMLLMGNPTNATQIPNDGDSHGRD